MNEKLLKIKDLLSSLLPDEKFEAITTDKGVLYVEKVEVDSTVEVGDENGENRTKAEDGDYVLEDGRTIKVADGKITEVIEKPEEEDKPAEEEKPEEGKEELSKFEQTKQNFEESYDEKMQKIANAITATGADGWIREAGDDFCIWESWNEATGEATFHKYPVSWDEEGNAVIGEPEEVKEAYVPKDEEKPEEEKPAEQENLEEEEKPEEEERDLAKEIDELISRVDELEKALKELKETPAKETPAEEFQAIKDADKNEPKAVKYMKALMD